ncbi:MAG: zinc-ribbon domain-containing protein, partial [Promethearchaeota archaeon]
TQDELILNMDEELFNYKKMAIVSILVGVFLLCIAFIGIIPIAIGVYRLSQLNSRPQEVEYDIRRRFEQKARAKGKRVVITYNPERRQFYSRQGYQPQSQPQYTPSTGYQTESTTKASYCTHCGNIIKPGHQYCQNCGAKLQ